MVSYWCHLYVHSRFSANVFRFHSLPSPLRRWLLVVGCLSWLVGCQRQAAVVLYCAQDQVVAEPILAGFSRTTGIRVQAVFDSEAVKTVGLAHRILAERTHPVGDVFWGNEEFQTRRLAAEGVFRETNGWVAFGQRSRRLVTGNLHRELSELPLESLTNSELRGRISVAFPLFGSTATHFCALRAEWGETRWLQWCRALAANRPFWEPGNSHVVQRVARGEAWVGLTDSDDIQAGRREGLILQAGPELLRMPNSVAVLRGAPHPAGADQLALFLQSSAIRDQLLAAGAIETGATKWPLLRPNWDVMVRDYPLATRQMQEVFQQ